MSFLKPLITIILLLSFAIAGISHEDEHLSLKTRDCKLSRASNSAEHSVLKNSALEKGVFLPEDEPSIPRQELPSGTWDIKQISYQKTFLYASLSFAPGGGVSDRTRKNRKGNALDIKIGAFPFVFDRVSWIPVITYDYNWLYYTRDNKMSPYFSCGFGAAYIVPYLPLRAGIEFQNGFVDIGAKMFGGFFPFPEIRGGYTINF